MTENFIELTEDEFDDRYSLVPNHINPSAGWAIGDTGGCLFETYGEEFAFIQRQDPSRVWTLVDGDDGDMFRHQRLSLRQPHWVSAQYHLRPGGHLHPGSHSHVKRR